ncbi:hypothetical protein Tco_1576025 [Tanacetum coccineum]
MKPVISLNCLLEENLLGAYGFAKPNTNQLERFKDFIKMKHGISLNFLLKEIPLGAYGYTKPNTNQLERFKDLKLDYLTLKGYSDSDWENADPLGEIKKQYMVPRSSAEAEYRALASITYEVMCLLNLVKDLEIKDLGIHGLGLVIVVIGKKLVVVLVGIVETVPASSTREEIHKTVVVTS